MYKLEQVEMDWVDERTYLGVVMQSNLKFDQHIILKKDKASKFLGASKHVLLAYTSLCHPILKYADTMWEPTVAKDMESLEILQHSAVRFIAGLKRRESVTEAAWPSASQTEIQDLPTPSSHENFGGRTHNIGNRIGLNRQNMAITNRSTSSS